MHIDGGSRSMLRQLTIEEYRAEKQARALVQHTPGVSHPVNGAGS